MNGFSILFYTLASFAILSAIGVISVRNPLYSALSLIVTLFSLAGLYVTLDAGFLAIIQILTYAGAILVLFIFIIMLLNLHEEELVEKGYSKIMLGLLSCLSLLLFLALGFILQIPRLEFPTMLGDFGSAHSLARGLFTSYVIPFEIAGVLLTVALVGAVLLAKRKFL